MLGSQGFVETKSAIKQTGTQLLPHSIEAETALLGALAIDPAQMLDVGYLSQSDFYLVNNGFLYEAMKTLFDKHGGYDWLTVTEYLRSAGHLEDIGGEAAIVDLMNATPTSYGAPEYAAIVYRHSISRQVIRETMAITEMAYQDVLARPGESLVNDAIDRLSGIDTTRNVSNGPKSIANGVTALLDRMEQIEQTGDMLGLKTGIKTLDYYLGGLQKKQLYLLAGRPGMGKSALALQISLNLARQGKTVLYFSLEMSDEKLSERLVSNVSGVPYEKFNRPGISERQALDIWAAADHVQQLPIIIDDTPGLTVQALRSITQKTMMTQPIDVLFVDHLGLISSAGKDEYHEVTKISHGLMALSKQLDIPVVALSQLSRGLESRPDKRPLPSDLRGSGHLEQDADNIMFLYRDEVYNPDTETPRLAEIIFSKNRHGKTGTAEVYASIATNKFVDLEVREVRL